MTTAAEPFSDLSVNEREALLHVLEVARRVAPDATAGVSYGATALKVDGKPLIAVSAAAAHLSLFPFSPAALDAVRGELEGFSVSKGTIRFTAEHPVDDGALERLIWLRLAEIRAASPDR